MKIKKFSTIIVAALALLFGGFIAITTSVSASATTYVSEMLPGVITDSLLTTSSYEIDSLENNGAGWVVAYGFTVNSGTTPVYRVFNPNSGQHYFTTSTYERDSLVSAGWRNEGIAFYSGGSHPVYVYYYSGGLHTYGIQLNGGVKQGIAFYTAS